MVLYRCSIKILLVFFFIIFSQISNADEILARTTHEPSQPQQVINIGIGDNPTTLDPQRMEDQVALRMAYDLYESLMTEAEDGTIIPGVAENYSIQDNGKIYIFYLRKNAKFSDGSQIQASDVVFTFRRLVDPKLASPSAYLSRFIENAEAIMHGEKSIKELGIEALNSTTVKIKLNHPVPYFLNMIAVGNFGILKEANVTKYKDSFTQPGNLVSSGAYMLTNATLGDKFTAQKNQNYWNASKVTIETVNYFPIVDANSEFQMYRAGQIDFTFSIPPNNIKTIRASFPNEIKINPLLGIYYLTLNTRKEPFKSNIKLRQALSMAIDRNTLTKEILGRGEIPEYDLVPTGIFNYVQQKYEWQTWPDKKRVQEANRLFKEAGYSDQKPFIATLTYNTDVLHKKVILTIVSMWQKTFGKKSIVITLDNLERKVFFDSIQNGKFLMARDSWFADYNDASVFTELLVSKNLQNFSGYQNLLYDKIHNESELEQNVAKRETLLEQGMHLAMTDYPVIPLFEYTSIHLIKPYVCGYTGHNILDHIYTRNLWLCNQKDK